jgi:exodeoxyribonuclease VII small subunit
MTRKKKSQSELPLSPPEADGAPPASAENAPSKLGFEQAVERLSQIVSRLESEELDLDESLRMFEEGVRLARHSQADLDRAEKRVQELLAFDEDGNPIVREIDPE